MMTDDDGILYEAARQLCIHMQWIKGKDFYYDAVKGAVHGNDDATAEKKYKATGYEVLNLFASILGHGDDIDVTKSNPLLIFFIFDPVKIFTLPYYFFPDFVVITVQVNTYIRLAYLFL